MGGLCGMFLFKYLVSFMDIESNWTKLERTMWHESDY